MNKGHIEIFQSNGDTHKSIFKGANMSVDGFRKTIADVMTYMPNPSGFEPGANSVSSYQIITNYSPLIRMRLSLCGTATQASALISGTTII